MNTWILSIATFLGATLWLTLLVVTRFSVVVVSIGMLAVLYMLNASAGSGHLSSRKRPALQRVAGRAAHDSGLRDTQL
jgi:hypothetical protein